jgi:hypothetical protein
LYCAPAVRWSRSTSRAQHFDQLEDRAVIMRVAARGDELVGDLLKRGLGVDLP